MRTEAFLSPSWYRLARLKPALKPQARVRRHRFRGETWYVVHDTASGRFNRFTPAAWQVLGLMDGRRTMDEVWSEAVEQLGDDAPGQEEVIRLLSQLHGADLLHCEVNPDSAELFDRFGRQERSRRNARWKNPLSIRIPVWDPDRFLERTLPWLRPLVSPAGLLALAGLALLAIALAIVHFPELTRNVEDRVLSANNLVLLWLCFPVVKLLHELGHAYAVKAGGGEVHEMGILLLVFTPVPYVEASAANGFRSKWRRALVGAAGMLVELVLSAVAMLVWVAAEPGMLRAIAFNVMLIAGVSTLVFNGNPLLRFDGYYILADLIEMPNLADRGNRYWRYLGEKYLLRVADAEPPPLTPGERRWLCLYTPLAFAYRMTVLVAISFYVAGAWFFIGVLIALWGLAAMVGVPATRVARYLSALPRAQGVRRRAIAMAAGLVLALFAFVLLVPMPMRIQTEGVVWLPDEAQVRAGTSGFVRAVLVAPGAVLQPGTPLVVAEDPALEAQVALSQARLEEMQAKLDRDRFDDRVQAALTQQDIARETATLERLVQREDQLVSRSGAAGRFVIDRPQDLPGRYVHQGELLAYVAQDARTLVRAVVSQDDIELLRGGVLRAEVRLVEHRGDVYRAQLVRQAPAARDQLPSAALTSSGGGAIAADPRDPQGARALATSFQVDLVLPPEVRNASYGARAYVRFTSTPEPLAAQWYRRLRQAFLQRFNV